MYGSCAGVVLCAKGGIGRGGKGVLLCFAFHGHLTVDHASLSRRCSHLPLALRSCLTMDHASLPRQLGYAHLSLASRSYLTIDLSRRGGRSLAIYDGVFLLVLLA